jgi:PAS domain S-box-containing protein
MVKFDAHAEIQRTLKKLKRQNLYFGSIFHSIHLAVVITNKQGKLTAINPAAQEMWNLIPKEDLGCSIGDLPFFSEQLQEKAQDTLQTRNKNEIAEWDFTHSSGEERSLSLNFVPLIDDQNEIIGVMLIGTDITSKKRLEKEKKILEGLLPICSHCKKIRDRHQEWVGLEQYIDDHSSAKFSHSICPDCVEKYYSNI